MNDFGLIVIGVAARATALAMLGFVAMALLRRRGPATAAMTTLTTLAVLVGVSALAVSPWPRWRLPRPDSPKQVEVPAVVGSTGDLRGEEGAKVTVKLPVETRSSLATTASAFFRELGRELSGPLEPDRPTWQWPAWAALAFAAGLGVAIARLGLGLWAVKRLGARSLAVEDPGLLAEVESIRSAMGLSGSVDLLETSEVDTPATTGWRRPVVLLPIEWREWDAVERRAVLAHELAHVLRGDYLAGLVAHVSLSIHFYHPMVHALTARLKLDQELAADAWGARLTGGQRPYLNALARLALRRNPRPAAWPARPFLPTRGTFLRRIEMLRDPQMIRETPLPRRVRALTVAALAFAGLVVAGFRGGEATALAQVPAPAQAANAPKPPLLARLDPSTVSADVHFVLEIRPAELLAKQAAWKAIAERPGAIDFKLDGPDFKGEDIEQVLTLGYDQPPGAAKPSGVFILRFFKPIDVRKVLLKDHKQVDQFGITYYKFTKGLDDANTECTRLLDDRTALVGKLADMVKPPIGPGVAKATHGWDDAWKSAGEGQIRMACDSSWLSVQMGDTLGKPGQGLRAVVGPLFDKVKAYGAGFDLTDGMVLDVLGVCETEVDAEVAEKTIKAGLQLIDNLLKASFLGSPPTNPGDGMNALAQGLRKTSDEARFERIGNRLRLRATLDQPSLNAATVAANSAAIAAERDLSVNHLKQLGLAMHNYHDKNDAFPPAVLHGPDGKTPYSWRVALLPFLEEKALYDQYKFDEPWDGPSNRKLVDRMPAVFGASANPDAGGRASYFALVGPSTLFPDQKEGLSLQAITDGSTYTILLAEAKRDIPWTKPEDILCPDKGPMPALGGYYPDGINVVFADGAVRFLKTTLDPAMLRALTTRNKGEVVKWPDK